ncbi:DegT/DnrJ/EryC1/StrS family aminotransferase [Candidatus Pelagibacter sp. HIMB1593]|uniref:DegT/DnrJ/EryC1/StrS family aminotransferase n=1 Tax=Candidatus Pelagibacter sp. HIMB1593 TaxID=3413355 RepID=UPI003F85C75A
MIKKTRININTSLKIYIKFFSNLFLKKGEINKKKFEKKLKNFLLTDNLLLTSQGRVAAYNIFKVILSKKKREILICPYTLTEIINAIIYAGGKPVYVEIDLNTGLPLERDLDKKINNNTAGLVLTHLYSNESNIFKFHEKYNGKLKIIEDVAINIGAKIKKEKFLGTIFDYGFYSFGIMKHLFTFHGGAIYSKDKSKLNEIEQNLKENNNFPLLSSFRLVFFCMLIDIFYSKYIYNFFTHHILKLSLKKLDNLVNPNLYPKLFKSTPKHYEYNFQNNFAFAGIESLKTLKYQIIKRIEKVKLYEKYIDDSLKINNYKFYEINSFLEYPLLLKKNNNKFMSKKLLKIGYDIRRTWYVNALRYLKLNFKPKEYLNCDYLHEKILSLPTHNNISEKDIIIICKLINFYERGNG